MPETTRSAQEDALEDIERLVELKAGMVHDKSNLEDVGKVILARVEALNSMTTNLSDSETLADLENLVDLSAAIKDANRKNEIDGRSCDDNDLPLTHHLEDGKVLKPLIKQLIATLEALDGRSDRYYNFNILDRLVQLAQKLGTNELKKVIAKHLSSLLSDTTASTKNHDVKAPHLFAEPLPGRFS